MTGHLSHPFCALDTVGSNIGSIHRIVRGTGRSEFFSRGGPVLFVSRVRHFDGSRRSSLLNTIRGNAVALVNTAARGPSFRIVAPLLSHYRICALGPLRVRSVHRLVRHAVDGSVRLSGLGVAVSRSRTLLHFTNNSTHGLLGVLSVMYKTTGTSGIIVGGSVMAQRLRRGPLTCSGGNRVRCSVVSTFVGDVHNSSPSTTVC